ncbi:hypothetical protein P5V15_009187 [Pogonomyrmex californicus]
MFMMPGMLDDSCIRCHEKKREMKMDERIRNEHEGMQATWHVTFYNVYFINCNYMYAFAFSCPTCKLLTQMLHKRKK